MISKETINIVETSIHQNFLVLRQKKSRSKL